MRAVMSNRRPASAAQPLDPARKRRTVVRFTTGASQWWHLNQLLAIAVGQREASLVRLDFYRSS
jgi:hypothetical protein